MFNKFRKSNTVLIYYDGTCNMCRMTMKKLKSKDINNNLLFLKVQDLSDENIPASKDEMLKRIHCIKANETYNGISAMIEIIGSIKGYRILLLLMKIGRAIGIGDKVYDVIARNRKLVPVNTCASNDSCRL